MEAQFDVQILTVISGVFIPLLVGLVSKQITHSGVKAVLNALLSTAAGTLAVLIETGGEVSDVKIWIFNIALTWVISIATYYGLWKPTGVAPAVQDATKGFGL